MSAPMSVFDKHRDTLEVHETMMGSTRGRLAVALDLLTDSVALVGQHGVYCRSERLPGKPKMDIALILEQLDDVKQLRLREYFSAGLPVVSIDIPEVRHYADFEFGEKEGALGCGV